MKVIFNEEFYRVYTGDPAAAPGRMEAVVRSLEGKVDFVAAEPLPEEAIALAHSRGHISRVRNEGLYTVAALAAGGAFQAARTGLREPAFGLVRPPGHHASGDSCWGFCYFNNMAVALLNLREEGLIKTAFVLDIDLHRGDGTIHILGEQAWVKIHNPSSRERKAYLSEVEEILSGIQADIIGVSAGFDHHVDDWGGLLTTEDYLLIGGMVRMASSACGGGCFGILEGGYNHHVLGTNVAAFLDGLGG